MPFRSCLAVVTAVLFVLSAIAQHVVAAGMAADGGMEMPATVSDMPLHDDTTHCPMQSDCAKDMGMLTMACFAHCATVLGILSEPFAEPASIIGHKFNLSVMHPLASLHGPPEPHPPRPVILI
jgi:hypothetical protein